MLEVILSWGTGGKSKYKAADYLEYMPADYDRPKRKRKRGQLAKQLAAVAAHFKARQHDHNQ